MQGPQDSEVKETKGSTAREAESRSPKGLTGLAKEGESLGHTQLL
jgi:hypothetical protein